MLGLLSFGYKHIPGYDSIDLTYDCRSLPNPWTNKKLRDLTGESLEVRTWLRRTPEWGPFFSKVVIDIERKCPMHLRRDPKEVFYVQFGCLGGKHRSVAMMLDVASHFARKGWKVQGKHLSLEYVDAGRVDAL